MESENSEKGNNSGGGGEHQVNSRWNPTKEQINILENMYMEGVRTPSADQIQQITARLKAYGEIEGKNVFYWFQNHKARQRQKLKQENFDSISRYLYKSNHHHHHHHPMFVPPVPSPNGVCGTYYLPQGEIGIYPQYHPKVLIPYTGVKRRHTSDNNKIETILSHGSSYQPVLPYNSYPIDQPDHVENRTNFRGKIQQTLPLFPLHPTGNSTIDHVEDKEEVNVLFSSNNSTASESINGNGSPSSSSESTINGVVDNEASNHKNKPFFYFFSRPRQLPFESA